MDIVYLKSEFLNVKGFLHSLYSKNPRANAQLIINANDIELNTLIKILHLICTGKIHLRKSDFKILKKSKRLNFLKNFLERKDSYVKLLKSTREQKIQVLRKFCALYNPLLYLLFNLV